MLTVAYLANVFPSPVEPYVLDEIEELRNRGIRVITGTVRKPISGKSGAIAPEIILQSVSPIILVQAVWFCIQNWGRIRDLVWRIVFGGTESPLQRSKALLHIWLGACYAVLLAEHRVDHIHVHHGYFGSSIALVAARLRNVGFSLTLHGSDLLVRAAYLDVKLEDCRFCLTISEFNRRYILEHYPEVGPDKILVSRLGVTLPKLIAPDRCTVRPGGGLKLVAVGRLQAVKNHVFLIRACAQLASQAVDFECSIAGDGPERNRLTALIRDSGIGDRVELLGHVPRKRMDALYDGADVVVLTSHSEGIPLVLMEAMARGKIVLAPAITGIPELVLPGKTGFLYPAGSLADFVDRLFFIRLLLRRGHHAQSRHLVSEARQLDWMRFAAQLQVFHNFNRTKNLKSFADLFLARITPLVENLPHANFILQQI